MGMNMETLAELACEIMAQGYDEATAWHYAALIGDTPVVDSDGTVIVYDEADKIIARLKPLKMFSER